MNNKIANIIVSYIKELDWIDKITGLTQVARVKQGDTEKRFPISCDMTFEDACKKGCYDDLMPSSKRSSVIFFEDGAFSYVGQGGKKLQYESRLRMICWLNYKKLPGGCGSTGDYILSIIKALPSQPVNKGGMISLSIIIAAQSPRSSDIFGKYTFDEKRSQFLMLPYDFFSLDIRTNFYVIPECVEPTEGCNEC